MDVKFLLVSYMAEQPHHSVEHHIYEFKKYNTEEFAMLIHYSPSTVKWWRKQGKFPAAISPGGRPYYTDEHLKRFRELGGLA